VCDFETGYTTIVGPDGELRRLLERWDDVTGNFSVDGRRPTLVSLRDHHLGHVFDDDRCPSTAVIWHQRRADPSIAHFIQARILANLGPSNILCEPGFRLELAGAFPPMGHPILRFDVERVSTARAAIPFGAGRTVAILDTGDGYMPHDMIDFVGGSPSARPSEDGHGHGTAVAGLIHALRSSAQIVIGRVANESGRVESKDLFVALVWALWSGRHDVVNVSISSQLAGQCSTMLGGTLPHLLELCRRDGGAGRTRVVAAAGNGSDGQRIGYPALLPDVDVAVALDWTGAPADYNVDVSDFRGRVMTAFGGTESEPFGTITGPAGTGPIYGTSFAAAVVTASHLA
jgi:hypothetical protein